MTPHRPATSNAPSLGSRLRYQWGHHAPQPTPTPARAQALALLLDDTVVWQGDVTEELRAWARGCARAVAHLWNAPDVVQQYLETGNEVLKDAMRELTQTARTTIHVWPVPTPTAWAIKNAAEHTSRAAADAAEDKPAWMVAQNAARSAAGHLGGAYQDAAREAQAAHLRALLLCRALPTHLHPLLDDPAHEAVLCNALLEAARG